MDWLSFFIGVLVGWIVEWLIDVFYWRRRCQSCEREKEALQVRLREAEKRIKTYQVKGWEPETAPQRASTTQAATQTATSVPPVVDLDTKLTAPEVKEPDRALDAFLEDLKARFPDVDLDASISRLRARIPDLDIKGAFQGLKAELPDLDLDRAVDGLRAKFPQLGEREVEMPPITPPQPDDLKLLEGIGPKIAALLRNNDILTFAQLADTSVERLQAILNAAGPSFQLADPATWPEQAGLAAAGAWDELRALQERLTGGQVSRRAPR